jgi:hypothetical protein
MRRVLPASRPRFTIRFSLTLMVWAACGMLIDDGDFASKRISVRGGGGG